MSDILEGIFVFYLPAMSFEYAFLLTSLHNFNTLLHGYSAIYAFKYNLLPVLINDGVNDWLSIMASAKHKP